MKLKEKYIERFLADFHYELSREQMEKDWELDKKKPYYKQKDCYIFRTADGCWMEIAAKDVHDAFEEPFKIPAAIMAQRDAKGRFVRTKPDYKALYEAECKDYNKVMGWFLKTSKQRDFLLEHAGPILRWRYNRKFKKDA